MDGSLDFIPIALEHKDLFDDFFGRYSPNISEFTFTNLFCWRLTKGHEFAITDGHLLVSFFWDGHRRFYQPIGEIPEDIIRKLLKVFPESSFERVEAETAGQMGEDYLVEYDRDMSDYVYDIQALRDLEGSRFAAKRNFIKRCDRLSPVTCELDEDSVGEFFDLEEEWCNIRSCHLDKNLHAEDLAVKETLQHFGDFPVFGICIRIEGKIEAFSIAEPLNATTYVEHFEKANTHLVGLYPYVLHELVKRIPEKYTLLNREQDLGVEGLRKSKLSYHPVRMIEKFTIKNRHD